MSCETGYKDISIQELEVQLEDAKKALVDRKYVKYENQGHLFDYKIDFTQFLEDISDIFTGIKKLPENDIEDTYKRA